MTDSAKVERLLAPGADAFLHHDRPIEQAADDGVVRVIAGRVRAIRLGRGSAPMERTLQPRRHTDAGLGWTRESDTRARLRHARRDLPPYWRPRQPPMHGAVRGHHRSLAPTLRRASEHPRVRRACWLQQHSLGPAIGVAHGARVASPRPRLRRGWRVYGEARWLCFTWDGTAWGQMAHCGAARRYSVGRGHGNAPPHSVRSHLQGVNGQRGTHGALPAPWPGR